MNDQVEGQVVEQEDDAAYEAAFAARVAEIEGGEPAAAPAEPVVEPTEEPAQEAQQEGAEQQNEQTETQDVVADFADVLTFVPEEKRAALADRLRAAAELEERTKKLEHENRSIAGRISAYQKRYEEAANKLRSAPAVPAAPAAAQAPAQNSAEWAQFVVDFPDIAKAIESRTAALAVAGPDPRVAEALEYIENEKRARYMADAQAAVESVHPGWVDVARSADFQAWKATSPTYEKLAASDDVADAIALFDLWGAHRARDVAPTATPAQAAAAATLAARRGAQVAGAKAPTNRATAPNINADPDSEDSLFAFYANKANQRLRAR